MADVKKTEMIDDATLDGISGGPEYLAPGVYVEETSFRTRTSKSTAGLRSDGDLVQSVSDAVYLD